jgi:CheY-like chemotaxis protein
MPEVLTLLTIDDEVSILGLHATLFEKYGYRVLTATSGAEGIAILRNEKVAVVIVDYQMPTLNGSQTARAIRLAYPMVPIIMQSGISNLPIEATKDVDGFFAKGEPLKDLLTMVESLLGGRRMKATGRE